MWQEPSLHVRARSGHKTNLTVSVNTLHPWCVNVREWLINISKEANTQLEALWNLFLILVGTVHGYRNMYKVTPWTAGPHLEAPQSPVQASVAGLQVRASVEVYLQHMHQMLQAASSLLLGCFVKHFTLTVILQGVVIPSLSRPCQWYS